MSTNIILCNINRCAHVSIIDIHDVNAQESLSLSDVPLGKIQVNATVIFSILNSYSRRTARESRVIGTLLGEVQKDGTVVVSSSLL